MGWEQDFVEIIAKDFETRRRKNLRFSQKAYSKKLGLSAAAMSDLLSKKKDWRISPRRASAILKRLEINPSIRNKLLVRMGEAPVHRKAPLPGHHKILTQWYYIPIWVYFNLPKKYRSVSYIAEKLELSESKVHAVIKELVKFGMLEKNSDGDYVRPDVYSSSSDGLPNDVFRNFNEMNLHLFLKMYQRQDIQARDVTSLTFVGSKKKIDALRTEIRALYEKASSLMDEGAENDAVFRLAVQLSPLEFT